MSVVHHSFAQTINLPQIGSIQPGVVRDGHVESQLISAYTSLIRGKESLIGLRLKMDEHWHTYWKNPGDSGLATTIQWTLPEGVTVSDIDWPAPDYFEVGGLASYAYEGEIVLPMRVTVPESFEGDSITLSAQVDWLVCRESCEPGEAALTLTLPVGSADAGKAVAEQEVSKWRPLFEAAAKRTPIAADNSTQFMVQWRDGMYRVVVTDEGIPSIAESVAVKARFFPDESMVIDAVSSQNFEPTDFSGFAIQLVPHRLSKAPVEQLTGVVTYQHGDSFRAYRIDEPVRDVAAGNE